MFSKREREGYVMIDHRESPGFSCDELPGAYRANIAVGPGAFFEGATLKCAGCDRIVVLNPDRTRERGYCYSCDKFLCDNCATAQKLMGHGECNCIDRIIDKVLKGQVSLI